MSLELTRAMTLVLIVLSDSPRHGYSIMTTIEEMTDYSVSAGTLYRSLERLQNAELLKEIHEHSLFDSEDERRRYYQITDSGRKALNDELTRLEKLLQVAKGDLS